MKLLLLLVIYHLSLMTVYFKSGDRIPVGGEIFRTHPDQPCGPYLLYNGYQVSFLGGKSTEVWRWPPTWSSTKVKERVELYIYSPSGPLWPVLPLFNFMQLFFCWSHHGTLRTTTLYDLVASRQICWSDMGRGESFTLCLSDIEK